jgi:hypothetical protein
MSEQNADYRAPSRPPDDWWRPVPCGHPPDPVAWLCEGGWACHCGKSLDPARKSMVIDAYDIVQCGGCGCAVGIPTHNDRSERPE